MVDMGLLNYLFIFILLSLLLLYRSFQSSLIFFRLSFLLVKLLPVFCVCLLSDFSLMLSGYSYTFLQLVEIGNPLRSFVVLFYSDA